MDDRPPVPELREVPSRYRVHLLPHAKPTERGVLYLRGEDQFLLAWSRVKRAFAARVGGGGQETVVFDQTATMYSPSSIDRILSA